MLVHSVIILGAKAKKGQFSLSWHIKKYGDIEGPIKYEERCAKDKIKGTLIGYIGRYGEVEGPIKYAEKNSRLSVSEKSLKANGFSDTEIENIKDIHAKKSAITLENQISKYGIIEGTTRHNLWLSKSKERSNCTLGYWIKRGYSHKEAKELLSERQSTSTLDKFIVRYGVEEGTLKYLDVNKRKTKGLFGNTVSKLEMAFFNNLSKVTYISENGKSCKLRFDELNIVCDYLDASTNKIIEINGDFWHMNPIKFNAYDINVIKKCSARDIWENESRRLNFLKSKGYNTLVIWESELNEDYDTCLNLAKEFLENK